MKKLLFITSIFAASTLHAVPLQVDGNTGALTSTNFNFFGINNGLTNGSSYTNLSNLPPTVTNPSGYATNGTTLASYGITNADLIGSATAVSSTLTPLITNNTAQIGTNSTNLTSLSNNLANYKLSLSAVATSGVYSDLTGKPTLGTASASNATAFDLSGAATAASNGVMANLTNASNALQGQITTNTTAITGNTASIVAINTNLPANYVNKTNGMTNGGSYAITFSNGIASTNVVYASALGAHLNGTTNGGGTDDYAIIQAALNRNSNAATASTPLKVIIDGPALISSGLHIYGNTELAGMNGGALYIGSNANTSIIYNAHRCGTNRFDTNISITDLVLNGNKANNSIYETNGPTANGTNIVWNEGIYFLGVDGVRIQNVQVAQSIKFAALFGNCTNGYINGYYANNGYSGIGNDDGLHWWGPSGGFHIYNYTNNGVDDAIALNGDELIPIGFPNSGPLTTNQINTTYSAWMSEGGLEDIHVDGVTLSTNCKSAVRILSTVLNNCSVDHVTGFIASDSTNYGRAMIVNCEGIANNVSFRHWNIGGAANVLLTAGLGINNLDFEDWHITNFVNPGYTNNTWMVLGDMNLTNFTISDVSVLNGGSTNDLISKQGTAPSQGVVNLTLNNIHAYGFNSLFNDILGFAHPINFSALSVDSGSLFIGKTNVGTGIGEVLSSAARDSSRIGSLSGSPYFTTTNDVQMTAFLSGLYARFGYDQVDCVYDFQTNHQSTNGTVFYGAKNNALLTGTDTLDPSGILFGSNSYVSTASGILGGSVTPTNNIYNTGPNQFAMCVVLKKPTNAAGYLVPLYVGNPPSAGNQPFFAVTSGNINQFIVASGTAIYATADITSTATNSFFYASANVGVPIVMAINNGSFGGNISTNSVALASPVSVSIGGGSNLSYPTDIAIAVVIKHPMTSADSQWLYALIKSTIGSGLSLP